MSDTVRQQAEIEAAASRVMARADQLAALSETADALTRVYLSPEHLQANQLVGQWMQAAGMMVWQDSVGNICGRYEGVQEGAPAVLLGSHLDTVRNAGRYDGMLGVLAAIEVVQRLHQQGRRLAKAIEIVGFGDEEGTRFGITLLGSRGVTGTARKLAVTVRCRRGERRPCAGECRTRSGADRPCRPQPAGYRRLSRTAYRAGAVPGAGGSGARRGGGD